MGVTLSPLSNQADHQLIARWQRGDQLAASEIVRRHTDALMRFVWSLGERAATEEVVQDAFVRAFTAIDSFRGESSFRTWLFTIARRQLLDRRRRERRARLHTELEEGSAVTHYNALDTIVAGEAQAQVARAINTLSSRQKEVFLMRVEQGLSYREIAEITGNSEGATRVHYHNAMRTIKEFLS